MLVLSRHRDEKVILELGGIQIALTIVDIRGDKVRLGFDAPREVKVNRLEVFKAIQKEK